MSVYPLDSEARRLAELEEARGELLSVFCRVAFPEELREQLESLTGKTCAILRLDGRYHIREVSGHA